MGSKRTKKSKQELELFSDTNNMKKNDENDQTLEPVITDTSLEHNGIIPDVIPKVSKAPKRKKKNDGAEVVPKKMKKTNDSEKVKAKRRKKSVSVDTENVEIQQPMNGEKGSEIIGNTQKNNKGDSPEKKKVEITWPDPDITELINQMEINIPQTDILAYRSRVEKLNWNNVAFKNYTADECKNTWLQVQKRIRRFRLLREVLNDAKEWVNTPRTNHKVPKPKKHPDMPRRPLSSYLLFYLNKKDEIINENPGLDGTDITKIVGQIYKNLPPEKREQYEKLAASNKQEYMEKLRIFFDNHPEIVPPKNLAKIPKVEKEKSPPKVEKEKFVPKVEKEKLIPKVEKEKSPPKVEKEKLPTPEKLPQKLEKEKAVKVPKVAKAVKDKDKLKGGKPGRPPKAGAGRPVAIERPPKKCQTAFGLYFASELNNMEPEAERSAFKEKCKQRYKEMPDDQKVVWINLAEEDLIRYQQEGKAYKAKYPDYKIHKVTSILTKRERASKERASGKPVKPPNSAYALFSRVMLQSDEIKSVHPKDRMNYISNKWKTTSEEDQNGYRDQVVGLLENYKEQYQRYVDTLPDEEKRKILQQSKKKKVRKGGPGGKRSRKPKATKKVQPPKIKFTEPEQPPISACKYFATVYKGEDDPVQAWKALAPEEKKKYQDELVKKKQAYIVEFERFLKSLSKEELEAFSKTRQQVPTDDEEESSECSSGSEGEDEEPEENENENADQTHNENEPHESESE